MGNQFEPLASICTQVATCFPEEYNPEGILGFADCVGPMVLEDFSDSCQEHIAEAESVKTAATLHKNLKKNKALLKACPEIAALLPTDKKDAAQLLEFLDAYSSLDSASLNRECNAALRSSSGR